MWIIVATVLLLYLLGFLFICFLNAENQHGNPSNSDNNSLSASNTTNTDDTENFYQRHHHQERLHNSHNHHEQHQRRQRCYRLWLHRLFRRSSSCHYDEVEDARERESQRQEQQHQQQQRNRERDRSQNDGGSCAPALSSDPSRSSLFAYRQQQLRQIHHEINEMSHLLEASQTQSGQHRIRSFPLPIGRGRRSESQRSNPQYVQQTLVNGSGESFHGDYLTFWEREGHYRFLHQLLPSSSLNSETSPSSTTTAARCAIMIRSGRGGGESSESHRANAINNSNTISVSPGETRNITTAFTTPSYNNSNSSTAPSLLSYSPSSTESCHIFRERQRRLRHIRMELEGLSLQLTQADAHGQDGNYSGDSSSLIYFSSGDGHSGASVISSGGNNGCNGSSAAVWSDDNKEDLDDLPGYESLELNASVALDSSSHQAAFTRGESCGSNEEESPPPSYSEAVHLYSFGEDQRK